MNGIDMRENCGPFQMSTSSRNRPFFRRSAASSSRCGAGWAGVAVDGVAFSLIDQFSDRGLGKVEVAGD
jgi:uncharacterized protein (DUF736 family)